MSQTILGHPLQALTSPAKWSVFTCVKTRDRKVVCIYVVCVGAFLAFLGDVLFPLSPPPPHPSSPFLPPMSPPSHPPDGLLSLTGIGAGRLSCGWRDQPRQLCESQRGAVWVSSRPLTHCRGPWGVAASLPGEAELLQFELQAPFPLFPIHFQVLGFREEEGLSERDQGSSQTPARHLPPALLG